VRLGAAPLQDESVAAAVATLERHGKGVGTTRRSVVVTCPLCRKRARGSRGDTPLVK